MEQSSLFVIACIMELFDRIPGHLPHDALRGYCDAGLHFRSSCFLAQSLVRALETSLLKEVGVRVLLSRGSWPGRTRRSLRLHAPLGQLRRWREGHQPKPCTAAEHQIWKTFVVVATNALVSRASGPFLVE